MARGESYRKYFRYEHSHYSSAGTMNDVRKLSPCRQERSHDVTFKLCNVTSSMFLIEANQEKAAYTEWKSESWGWLINRTLLHGYIK